jgi:hypothetical protein
VIASLRDVIDAIAGLSRGFDADVVGLGLHGLLLTLRARRGYPSDAARGAVIQAAEALRTVIPPQYALVLDQALAIADGALLTGDDAVQALTAFATDAIARLDRAAERCGRHAAALLDENDCLLIIGDGAALRWMLQRATAHGMALKIADADRRDEATICLVAGACALMNGDVAGMRPAEVEMVTAARRRSMPVYALAPNGPIAAAPEGGRILAQFINAIITDRGIYRPERIAAYQHPHPSSSDRFHESPGGRGSP